MEKRELEPTRFLYKIYNLEVGLPLVRDFLNGLISQDLINQAKKDLKTGEKFSEAAEKFSHNASIRMDAGLEIKEGLMKTSDKSFIVCAYQADKIIGFRIVFISDNKVNQDFFGVSYDHLKRGVATNLVKESNDKLLSLNINSYTTSLNSGSLAVITKSVGEENVEHIRGSIYNITIS